MFLKKGYKLENRKKALAFAAEYLSDLQVIDKQTVHFQPYGVCHFAAYTDTKGAMISGPDKNEFGTADWHQRDHIMMFSDYGDGDGRVVIFVCPIKLLFDKRTRGKHGVLWNDVRLLAKWTKEFDVS